MAHDCKEESILVGERGRLMAAEEGDVLTQVKWCGTCGALLERRLQLMDISAWKWREVGVTVHRPLRPGSPGNAAPT